MEPTNRTKHRDRPGRLDRGTALGLYRTMVRIRKFEEELFRLFSTRAMPGSMHQYDGEEAVAAGVCAHLGIQDYVSSTHRGHGHCIAKGADLRAVMAEMFAKDTGCCRGLGGSMHIADFRVGMLGANGIVAGGIPIAVGSALSAKMQGIDRVVVDFFGDGATNEGSFHEALNLASIWKLPVLFVCVNNQYGMSMHVSRHMAIQDIAARASSYGLPGRSVDGNDIFQVYEAALQAREYVRTQGPLLLVTNTYRIMGHSKSDANVYRTREEVEEWRKRCPLKRMKERLLAEGLFSAAELQDIETRAERTIREALEFAEASPEPALETATEDVYAGEACS